MKCRSRIFSSLFALFLLVMTSCPALAAEHPATLNDVVSALEKGYATLQDVQADFSQRTSVAGMKREQRGNGELLLKRPGSSTAMFRFNYARPKQQIVSNGKQVWFYLPDSNQVMVSSMASMFKGGNAIALSYLTGMGHVSRDFSISFARERQDKNGNYQLELLPKKPSAVLARLSLSVSGEAVSRYLRQGNVRDIFPIVSSVIVDAGGNQTRIDYGRARVNRGISSAKFTFRPPPGVDVIQQ